MSMITEQVIELREYANNHKGEIRKICLHAANTIEQLAAKVRAENNVSQPCEDAISRQAVIDAINANCIWENEYNLTSSRIKKAVESLPPVNPQPKTGHWIFDEILDKHYYCSECKSMGVDYWDFCPYCGAKMVEPQETETWNGIHTQLTAPKGTFERIFNDADDENDI